MITKEMVRHIKDTLNSLTQGKNENFGKNKGIIKNTTNKEKTNLMYVFFLIFLIVCIKFGIIRILKFQQDSFLKPCMMDILLIKMTIIMITQQ